MSSTETPLSKLSGACADENPTKESLQWFQSKYDQWKKSPWKKSPHCVISTRRLAENSSLRTPTCSPTSSCSSNRAALAASSDPRQKPAANPSLQQSTPIFERRGTESTTQAKSPIAVIATSLNAKATSSPILQIQKSHGGKQSQRQQTKLAHRQTSHREHLTAFYEKYDPSKLSTVEETLVNYQGREDVLFQRLQEKYVTGKDGIVPPSGTGPFCFLDFEVGGNYVGRVVVKLFHDKAPLACENFRCLCTGEKGQGRMGKPLCFQNCKMHRIVPNFCVQGGDIIQGDGTGGESIYPPNSEHGDMWGKFKDETPFLQHSRKGLLSMANSGPNRNGSQFFFTLKAIPHLDGKHVVFGEVVEGLDVVEHLGAVETNTKQQPLQPVIIRHCGELSSDRKALKGDNPFVSDQAPSGLTDQFTPGKMDEASAAFTSHFGSVQKSLFSSVNAASPTQSYPFSSASSAKSSSKTAFTLSLGQFLSGKCDTSSSSESKTQPTNPFPTFDSIHSRSTDPIRLTNSFTTRFLVHEAGTQHTRTESSTYGTVDKSEASASTPCSMKDPVKGSGLPTFSGPPTISATPQSTTFSFSFGKKETSGPEPKQNRESAIPFVSLSSLPVNSSRTKDAAVAFGEGLKVAGFSPVSANESKGVMRRRSSEAKKYQLKPVFTKSFQFTMGKATPTSITEDHIAPTTLAALFEEEKVASGLSQLGEPSKTPTNAQALSITQAPIANTPFGGCSSLTRGNEMEPISVNVSVHTNGNGSIQSSEQTMPLPQMPSKAEVREVREVEASAERIDDSIPRGDTSASDSGAPTGPPECSPERRHVDDAQLDNELANLKICCPFSFSSVSQPSSAGGQLLQVNGNAASQDCSASHDSLKETAEVSDDNITRVHGVSVAHLDIAVGTTEGRGTSSVSLKCRDDAFRRTAQRCPQYAAPLAKYLPPKQFVSEQGKHHQDSAVTSHKLSNSDPERRSLVPSKPKDTSNRPLIPTRRRPENAIQQRLPRAKTNPNDVQEAVADILAERLFVKGGLLSEISLVRIEVVMALSVERMVDVLQRVDMIEAKGQKITWADIESVIKPKPRLSMSDSDSSSGPRSRRVAPVCVESTGHCAHQESRSTQVKGRDSECKPMLDSRDAAFGVVDLFTALLLGQRSDVETNDGLSKDDLDRLFLHLETLN